MTIFFIKKLWQNEADESVHSQFIRFSRGKFESRFVTNISRNGKCKLSGTFDLANNLVEFAASLSSKINVNGILFTKENPEPLLKTLGINASIKKKAAIFQAEFSAELAGEQINKILEKAYFTLFDCTAEGIDLKIKKKLPRPAKSGGKVNDKFCVLEMDMKYFPRLKEEFAFDIDDFKKAQISHTVEVKDIILPIGEKDFEKIRLNAKKKGTITRIITINGTEKAVEKDFLA